MTARPKYVRVDRVVMETVARDLGVKDAHTLTNAELIAAVYNSASSLRAQILVGD